MIDNIKILHESDEIVQNPMFIKIKVIQSECDMNFNLKKWNHIFEDVRHDEVIGKPLDKTYFRK